MGRQLWKQRAKQWIRFTIGEPYVGKRLKLRRLGPALRRSGLDPSAILEFGCEDGTFAYWLADRYPDAMVTAVDVDAAAVDTCRAARPRRYAERVQFEVGSFDSLPAGAFDLITALDVFEHIEEDSRAVEHLARALRPGGTLVAHVPRDRWRMRSGELLSVPPERAAEINPGHVRQGYSPEALKVLLESAGLSVESVETWIGPWGVLAYGVYTRFEHPRPLRLLSLPVTDLLAYLDARTRQPEGNTVYARAVKPA